MLKPTLTIYKIKRKASSNIYISPKEGEDILDNLNTGEHKVYHYLRHSPLFNRTPEEFKPEAIAAYTNQDLKTIQNQLTSLKKRGNDRFCNPPISDQFRKAFITRAQHEQYRGNAGTMILPYAPAAGWFRQYLGKGVIIYEPDGRYNYNDTNGVVQKGCNFDSCVVVFPACYLRDSIRIPYD